MENFSVQDFSKYIKTKTMAEAYLIREQIQKRIKHSNSAIENIRASALLEVANAYVRFK